MSHPFQASRRETLFVRRILGAMGLGSTALLFACGGSAVVDGSEGAGGSGSGGTGSSGPSTATASTGTGQFWCNQPTEELWYTCISPQPGGCPSPDDAADPLDAALGDCVSSDPDFCACDYVVASVPCGPDPDAAACCYYVAVQIDEVCEGRPFVVDGAARKASIAFRDDWFVPVAPAVEALDAETRRTLAAAWLDDALAEHSSVASFARFVLELLELGAPAELVHRAQQAIADEIRHAELCFGLASSYGAESVGPGRLPVHGSLERRDLPAIAAATAREGCINETLAALVAAAASDAARDPAVCAALDAIVEDEAEHAALAWGFVSWACRRDPRAHAAVREVFENLAPAPSIPQGSPSPGAGVLRAHGQLPEHERRAVAARGLREVVMPCARTLLQRVGSVEARV